MSSKVRPIEVAARINPKEYVQVPGHNTVIYALGQLFNGEDFRVAHVKTSHRLLDVPTLSVFTTHYKNCWQASRGKGSVYYADGGVVEEQRVQEMWDFLSGNGNCATWLSAFFANVEGVLSLYSAIKPVGRNKLEARIVEPLKRHVKSYFQVRLQFNDQGLPTKESTATGFVNRLDNLSYSPPRNGAAALYTTYNIRKRMLDCSADRSTYSGYIGVIPCAHGLISG